MRLFAQNLLQALRDLKKHAAQASVSALGIAISTVCLAFSINWLWSETHRDYFRPDYENIHHLRFRTTDSTAQWKNYDPHISYYYQPQLDSLLRGARVPYALYRPSWVTQKLTCADRPEAKVYISSTEADTAFLRIAGLKTLAGDARQALLQPDKAVITASVAQKLFGCSPAEAIGRSFVSRRIYASVYFSEHGHTVGAVVEDCKDPEATNLGFEAIFPLTVSDDDRLPNNSNFRVLIHTDRPEEVTETLRRMQMHEMDAATYCDLTPLRTLHNLGRGEPLLSVCFYPIAFCCISLILLLSALVNLTTTYTSIFLSRSREYALRHCLGATRWQNAAWMLTETAPVLLAGLFLAALGTEWCDRLDSVPGIRSHSYTALAWVCALAAALYLAGMAYPVHKMQRLYRASFGQGGGRSGSSHAWLLAVQCFACALLLFVSLGMQRQLSGMIGQDLGYDRENLLRLHTGRENRTGKAEPFSYMGLFYTLPDELRKERSAGITDVLAMPADIFNSFTRRRMRVYTEEEGNDTSVGRYNTSGTLVDRMKDEFEKDGLRVLSLIEVPYRAIDFFHIRVEGAASPVWSEEGEREGRVQVIVNPAAARLLSIGEKGERRAQAPTYYSDLYGANNAVIFTGSDHISERALDIRGVAPLRLTDFHEGDDALMLAGIPEGKHKCNFVEYDAIYVRHEPGRREEAEEAMRRVLRKFDVPEDEILIEPLDQYIAESYKEEAYYARLLNALTVFSLLITLSGVASMMLYSLRLRRRSLAIHRIMGADFRTVFRREARTYLWLTAAGCAAAFLPGYLLMRKWMEYFHYGSTPGIGLMLAIFAGMLALVWAIVYLQVRKAMNEKPVEVLRPES